mgnify:CR=1 FL=1
MGGSTGWVGRILAKIHCSNRPFAALRHRAAMPPRREEATTRAKPRHNRVLTPFPSLVQTKLGFLPPVVRGIIALLRLGSNALFGCARLLARGLVKLVLPFAAVRKAIDPVLNAIATAWIACNSGWMRLTQRTAWDVQGVDELRYAGWYLVNSCLLYTSPSPRDRTRSRMPSSA